MNKFILSLLFISFLSADNKTIFIGTIDSEPKEKIYKFQALANYLEEKLEYRDIKVDVEIPKDISDAIRFINNNKLDIFIDSVYPTLLVQKNTNISIECKRWKKGKEGYKSIIFTKKDSLLNKIEDLSGKTIAFEDEFSTSGYYMPRNIILNKGLTFTDKGDDGSIKFLFARSEKNAAAWVLFDKVDAAVTDDSTFNSFDTRLFKIIFKSKLIPRHLVSFSKTIDEKLKNEILDILYNMHHDKNGAEALKKFSATKKFSKLTDNDIKLIRGF